MKKGGAWIKRKWEWKLAVPVFIFFILWWFWLPSPLFDSSYSTVLLDRDGEVLGVTVAEDEQLRFQEVNRLPLKYVAAVMAFEDRRFALHRGVDWLSMGRAFVQNIRSGRVISGGSTLSMQVVRLSRKNPPRTIFEKLREIVLTLRLEAEYSKWEILCMYASHAPFGGNIIGVGAASAKYFNRQPEQLSWAEAALLAVLPNAPALIFPGKNDGLLKRKRDALLDKLCQNGMLGTDDYQLAIAEPLPVSKYDITCISPHLLARAYREHKGQISGSFIDRRLQARVNEIVARHSRLLSHNLVYNAAVLVAHIPTGEVRAYIGNSPACEGSRGNSVDIIRSVRSSGSILKPALYALMQHHGFILPRTLIPDVPSRFGGYAPSNFNKDFQGVAPADNALSMSLNIPFVRMLKDYNYNRFYNDLKRLGITSLNRSADDYGLSLILGGAETSLWDLCNMYGGMAAVLRHYNERDGQYYEGEYARLRVWQGEEGLQKTENVECGGIADIAGQKLCRPDDAPLSAAAIWHTLKALQNVERPEMESGWKNFASNMNLSWKTGTSFGFRDAWAVGVNAEYVVGVWVGNADGEGRPGLVGVRTAAPILFEVAGLLQAERYFSEPEEEMSDVIVCRKSGYRASEICDEKDTVKVCAGGLKTGICPYHRLVNLDITGQWRVSSDCETIYNMQIIPWFVLTPVQEWYYCRTHTDYKRLPPYRRDCLRPAEDVMEMIYPQRGTRVFIPRDFGGERGSAVFEAAHRNHAATIYWHIDDQYIGMTRNIHQMGLDIAEGVHSLTLVDEDGNTLRQSFRVVGKEK